VLTGGGSQLPGIKEVAEELFQRSVRIGQPINLPGIHDRLEHPRYTVAVGMILYTAARMNKLNKDLVRSIGNPLLSADLRDDNSGDRSRLWRNMWQRVLGKVAL